MKVSIYIEEGKQQIVLQPENKWEKNIIKSIEDKNNDITFHYGSFATCYGGYLRYYNREETSEDSLMIFIKEREMAKLTQEEKVK